MNVDIFNQYDLLIAISDNLSGYYNNPRVESILFVKFSKISWFNNYVNFVMFLLFSNFWKFFDFYLNKGKFLSNG